MKFTAFHLMSYPNLPEDFTKKYRSVWVDIPRSLYDPTLGHHIYNDYLDQLELADRLGFDMAPPLAFTPQQINYNDHWILVMGRLKPSVTLQQVQSDMNVVTSHLAAANPKSNTGWSALVEPLKNDFLPLERIHNLWFLLGAVGFVLLITCANVANLLLAKAAGRQREIAIHTSMGASRSQIFLQFLTESLLLAALGGALGVAFGNFLLCVVAMVLKASCRRKPTSNSTCLFSPLLSPQ